MARQSVIDNREILELALSGYQSQLTRIDEAMAGIRSRLGIRGPVGPAMAGDGVPVSKKRTLSSAARRRIALAQKKRWAEARANKAEREKPTSKPKRKLSAAGRAAIVAATKKRWAALRAAKKATAKRVAPKTARKKMTAVKKAPTKKTTKPAVKSVATPVTTPAPATT